MPVLDAKALEIDSKGMAFLKSVLCPRHSSEVSPKNMTRIGKIRFHMMKRSRDLVASTI
jgi:hypothetical protein